MDKLSTNKIVPSSLIRTILIFLFCGFFLWTVVNVVFEICDIVWIDFMHYNPNRSHSNALDIIMGSPIDGLIAALFYSELPLITVTTAAIVSHLIWGYVPFRSLIIMVPLCILAIFIEAPSPERPFYYMDFVWQLVRVLPILVGCWWWNNRTRKSSE